MKVIIYNSRTKILITNKPSTVEGTNPKMFYQLLSIYFATINGETCPPIKPLHRESLNDKCVDLDLNEIVKVWDREDGLTLKPFFLFV